MSVLDESDAPKRDADPTSCLDGRHRSGASSREGVRSRLYGCSRLSSASRWNHLLAEVSANGRHPSRPSYRNLRRSLDLGVLVSTDKAKSRSRSCERALDTNPPNKALEPTPPSVTPRADARVAPAGVVAHL